MSDPTSTSTASRDSVPARSMPELTCELHLDTDFAQRVYRRAWDRLKGDLFVATVRTRANEMNELAQALEAFITEEFTKIRRDLHTEIERADVLIDNVKLTQAPQYKHAMIVSASYSTPRAKEYLDLIVLMDQLLRRYDMLWLGAVIETGAREDRCKVWQRRLLKVANRLRELGNQTRLKITKHQEQQRQPSSGPASPADDVEGSAAETGTEAVGTSVSASEGNAAEPPVDVDANPEPTASAEAAAPAAAAPESTVQAQEESSARSVRRRSTRSVAWT